MASLEKGRRNIEDGMKKNKGEIKRFQEKLDRDVKDKKKVAEVSKRLRSKGTTEGLRAIAAKGEQSGRRVDDQSRKDRRELDQKAHRSAKQRETQLKDRAQNDAKDAGDLKKASNQIKQGAAKSELKQAAGEAEKDGKYLDGKRRDQEKARMTSEKQAKDKEARVRRARPHFKR